MESWPAPTAGIAPRPTLERMDPFLTTVVFGFLTLGIYPLVKFWGAISQYRAMLPGRQTNVGTLFGIFVGISVAMFFLSFVVVGILLAPVFYVVGWKLLAETLRLRDEVRQRYGLEATPVHGASSHLGMWLSGQILCLLVVGFVPLVIQCWWFFADHTALADHQAARRHA